MGVAVTIIRQYKYLFPLGTVYNCCHKASSKGVKVDIPSKTTSNRVLTFLIKKPELKNIMLHTIPLKEQKQEIFKLSFFIDR